MSNKEKFACGCEIWNEGDTFYIKPCSKTCDVLQFCIDESIRRGNPVIHMHEGSVAG